MKTLIATIALIAGYSALAQDPQEPQAPLEPCEITDAKLPKFIMDALSSPHALKAKLYVGKDGTIDRSKVFLARAGAPDWIHAVADEKLGKGEELSFEAEVYADGTEVFEAVRRIDGKPKKISVRRDKTVRYVETTVDRASVPAEVAATLAKLEGFQADEWRRREGDNLSEFHVRGSVVGIPHRARLRADGTLMSVDKHLAAELEVAITSKPEPAAK